MKFEILRQERYSRGQLLLRTFFGLIYIALPHFFVLSFLEIWSGILTFLAFWSILFTGRYPRSMYEFQVKFLRWLLRVDARLLNLLDGYPKFGLNAVDESVVFEVEYPEHLGVGDLLLKLFFGFFYVLIPHMIGLYIRWLVTAIVISIAWWVVLITGKYPEGLHRFVVGTLRWSFRLVMYQFMLMTDKYPPLHGRPDEE